MKHARLAPLLYANVLVIATCGLIYELLAGTLASYVLGDSVRQFSLIIGLYLSAMGAGAWLSGFIDNSRLARTFVDIELGVALLGGLSAPLLFWAFAKVSFFSLLLYAVVFAIGTLVGLELPLLMRILRDQLEFKELVSKVLTFDYLGALAASLLFPLLLVPELGLIRTSLLFGIGNAAVGLWGTWLLAPMMPGQRLYLLRARAVLVLIVLALGLVQADRLTVLAEEELYPDPIVHAESSEYQRIVLTKNRTGVQLFLNGNLQFSSVDEHRYHEALVHPAAALLTGGPKKVLILGGGDGLALREVLKYSSVESVTLVDIDPAMTRLATKHPLIDALNGGAFGDPRVKLVHADAMIWLEEAPAGFDLAIVDFPDPNNFALGKLYTRRFYQIVRAHLAEQGLVAIQSTSPLFAPASFWCIVRTVEAAGFFVHPYHLAIPSFGVWGYVLAKKAAFDPPLHAPDVPLRFLNDQALQSLFLWPRDLQPVPVEINRLDNQTLVRLYEEEWRRFER